MKTHRVCLIGAGPSGLSLLRSFAKDKTIGETQNGVQVICFEKQSNLGGLWNFCFQSGFDEFGEPVHGSMYKNLWSNGPKEALEYADYTFEEHFGKTIGSYPPREVLLDYIRGRVDKDGIIEKIRFSNAVHKVNYNNISCKFHVTVYDLIKKEMYEDLFDNVVVATGHFSYPNVPSEILKNLIEFTGEVIHAHDFRDASLYAGKTVLFIGSSSSAIDIASQCYKYGAKSIVISYRKYPGMNKNWPDNFIKHNLITSSINRNVFFKDGGKEEVDVIILCTGYIYNFPFLDQSLKLVTENRLWPLGLYKGVVWVKLGLSEISFSIE